MTTLRTSPRAVAFGFLGATLGAELAGVALMTALRTSPRAVTFGFLRSTFGAELTRVALHSACGTCPASGCGLLLRFGLPLTFLGFAFIFLALIRFGIKGFVHTFLHGFVYVLFHCLLG